VRTPITLLPIAERWLIVATPYRHGHRTEIGSGGGAHRRHLDRRGWHYRGRVGADAGFVLAVGLALAFAFTNGLHDAANAIATLVATRAARPLPAALMAAFFNLLGPLLIGTAVADTVATIVQVPPSEVVIVIGAGLTGAVAWNVYTWLRGLPASSTHALVGGLMGAAIIDAGIDAVAWGPFDSQGDLSGVLGILLGLLLAVILGFGVALVIERLALRGLQHATSRVAGAIRRAQWFTSAGLAFSHGSNDAMKTVGIVAAMLLATGRTDDLSAPLWVVVSAAAMVTLGTTLGGWPIVRTVGRRIYPLRSVDGLVSQASSAGVIIAGTFAGAPISTSQVVASSIVGIGIGRGRWGHLGWRIIGGIGLAWVTTMPAAALIAAVSLPVWRLIGS
jgi:inorganic phosphate transporter, PiT family